eukprot:gene9173-biopygen4250
MTGRMGHRGTYVRSQRLWDTQMWSLSRMEKAPAGAATPSALDQKYLSTPPHRWHVVCLVELCEVVRVKLR